MLMPQKRHLEDSSESNTKRQKVEPQNSALILTASYDHNGAFDSHRGVYRYERRKLTKNGYHIIDQIVEDPNRIDPALFANESIGFVWIRAHGSRKSITFSKEKDLQSEEVANAFEWLPSKLRPNAVIFLDACSTASLEEDFYNNMQFEFAKLTLLLPDVTIIAPIKNAFMTYFKVNNDRSKILFESVESSYTLSKGIGAALGKETKAILRRATENQVDLADLNEELLNSLHFNNATCNIVSILNRSQLLYRGVGNDVDYALIGALRAGDFKGVKYLIEKLQSNVNYYQKRPIFDENASPLFAAIHQNNPILVQYLLDKGADINWKYKGKRNAIDYANQIKAEETILHALHQAGV